MFEKRKAVASALASLGRAAASKAAAMLQSGPRVEHSEHAVPELLYARGFLLCRTEDAPGAVADWSGRDVHGWRLHTDPRVPVDHAARGDREVWIVGDAFHPAQRVFTQMARHVLEGNLLETLDGIAGRFLLIHRKGSRIEIYHDAMGARSVFYGDGVVASHAGLAAEVLGSGLRDWIIPFITSRGYLNRDVKYLPGLEAPFVGVRQLTPNTRLVLPHGAVERYWPRAGIAATDRNQALAGLKEHLEGLRRYLEENELEPIIGLSAGRDSRGVFAALAPLRPRLFTFVRSTDAQSSHSADSRTARQLAGKAGLDLEIIKIPAPPQLDTASTDFAITFRQNTGYVRGNNSSWVEHYAGLPPTRHVFVRGFGGEVMRGFYQKVHQANSQSLSHLYDVNAGSRMSRDAFEQFIEVAGWDEGALFGYDPAGMFYWEHRMGIWGAIALSESDMAFRGLPGYNSRDLYGVFMGLPEQVDRRSIFESAVVELRPDLSGIAYAS